MDIMPEDEEREAYLIAQQQNTTSWLNSGAANLSYVDKGNHAANSHRQGVPAVARLHDLMLNMEMPSIRSMAAYSITKMRTPPYTDHFHDPILTPDLVVHPFVQGTQQSDKSEDETMQWPGKERAVPFPMRLYRMLNDADENSDIVAWQPHGRAFQVFDTKKFENDIMPKYFQTRKYSSFKRQLCNYQLLHIDDGPNKGGYWHEFFLRGRPDLIDQVKRRPCNRDAPAPKKILPRSWAPDFSDLPICRDLLPAERKKLAFVNPVSKKSSVDPECGDADLYPLRVFSTNHKVANVGSFNDQTQDFLIAPFIP